METARQMETDWIRSEKEKNELSNDEKQSLKIIVAMRLKNYPGLENDIILEDKTTRRQKENMLTGAHGLLGKEENATAYLREMELTDVEIEEVRSLALAIVEYFNIQRE
jgi:hypothetical protein